MLILRLKKDIKNILICLISTLVISLTTTFISYIKYGKRDDGLITELLFNVLFLGALTLLISDIVEYFIFKYFKKQINNYCNANFITIFIISTSIFIGYYIICSIYYKTIVQLFCICVSCYIFATVQHTLFKKIF